jgi:phage terminase large subunit-like protein
VNDENAILAYYQGIQDGSITVGKWIRMLYELIIDGLEKKRWFFDQRKASNAIRFIERFCHHYKGQLAPARIKLSLWQRAAISIMFGIVDADGVRQFTECLFIVGRKQGKTLMAAGIMTYLGYAVGEYGSEIYFLAPKLDQADLCYSALEFNVAHEPDLQKRTKSTKYRGLYIKETNTMIRKLPFTDKKSDGYNPMGWTADEVGSWQGDRGLKQWEVMVSGTGSRVEPFGMAISSAGYENDGIFDELFKRGTAFLNGNSREQHLLPLIYMIDDVEKWDDINELRKSLPGLGDSVSVKFILKEIDTAHESLSKKTEFLTKYANIKQNSSQAWLSTETIKRSFGGGMVQGSLGVYQAARDGSRGPNSLTLEDFDGCYALAGIDLSQTTDLTACSLLIEKDGVLYYFVKFFLPREKIEEATARDGLPYRKYIERGFLIESGDNFVNFEDCYRWFTDLIEKYHIYVLQIGIDRYCAQYLQAQLEAYGFHCDTVFQGTNLTGVINTTEGMLKDGTLQCAEDNDLMKIHLLDAALKTEAETNRKKLIKISKRAHVDGVAALLDAMCMRANKWEELKEQLKNEG